jgi:dihydroxy-acid dehydratase
VGENIADGAELQPATSSRPLAEPFKEKAGIAVLRGNLAPRGAVIKPSAATPALMKHTGRAVVFETATTSTPASTTTPWTSTRPASWC